MSWLSRRPPVAESEVEPPAETPETADRLRRIMARQQAPEPAAGNEPGPTTPIALMDNAFATLGITLDATGERISEAFDDLSFEPGQDPAKLDTARARLMSARDRLAQELGWLPESPVEIQGKVRVAAAAGDITAIADIRDSAYGLARLNLSTTLAAARPTDLQATISVLGDAQLWNADTTLDRIDEARLRAGFKPVDPDQWDRAVEDRLGEIATALAPCFADSQDGRTALTNAMQRAAGKDGRSTLFLEKVAAAHAVNIDRRLEQLNERISTYIDKLRERPSDQGIATTLLSSLDMWSQLRRPIQILEAARGLDDPSSAAILRRIRELAVDLANDHKQFDIALRLARALVTCFSQVPNLKQTVESEMPVLISNALLARLRSTCERVLKHHREFARHLPRSAMNADSPGLIGEVIYAFEESCQSTTPQQAGPWWLLRDLAIKLNNDHGHRDSALIITSWMVEQVPPHDVLTKLREDVRFLQPPPRAQR